MKNIFIISIAICFVQFTQAQNKITAPELVLSEDNDFLNFRGEGTDRGYTNGMRFSVWYSKKNKPALIDRLLITMTGEAVNRYGWGLTQLMYTPCDIETKKIQYHDRPYAGVLYISRSLISSNKQKKERISSTISLGTIGRYSYARETQTFVHKMIRYDKPEGWNNQIKPDIIIDYAIDYEKLLAAPSKNFELIGNTGGNAGTLQNDLLAGIQFRAGLLNNYFDDAYGLTTGKTKIFFYMKCNFICVMDNSSLQGGFFSHRSPYVIPKDSINRVQMNYEYGISIAAKKVGVRIYEQIQTQEFKGTYAQQIGNITLYFKL
jgi:lipid A 3-O-deacylase